MTTGQNEVVIRHVGLSAFYLYCLGDQAHICTTKVGSGFTFSFADPDNQCPELESLFFSTQGAAVGNAKALLDCAKDIKTSIAIASRKGSWTTEESL